MNRQKENTTPLIEEDDYLKASSSQDCTGLIPSGIQSSAELESYEELYPFLPKAVNIAPDSLKREDL